MVNRNISVASIILWNSAEKNVGWKGERTDLSAGERWLGNETGSTFLFVELLCNGVQ